MMSRTAPNFPSACYRFRMRFKSMSILMLWIAPVVSIGASASDSAIATAIQGTATVIKGDTMEIHGVRNRPGAIDAPESSQLCLDAANNRTRCDQKLAITLDDLIGGSVVTCGPTPQNAKLRFATCSIRSRTQASQII